MADLSARERVGRERERVGRERERVGREREEQHYSAHPSSPNVEVWLGRAGQGRAGLGLGCAIHT